jgi:hypothetical protein
MNTEIAGLTAASTTVAGKSIEIEARDWSRTTAFPSP